MQKTVTIIYKLIRKVFICFGYIFQYLITWMVLYCNNVRFQKFHTKGIPYVSVARGGTCTIGDNFKINNSIQSNPKIGRAHV